MGWAEWNGRVASALPPNVSLHELLVLGKIRGTLFSHPANKVQDTNGKSVYQRQFFVSGMFNTATQGFREGCDVRKYGTRLVTTIL